MNDKCFLLFLKVWNIFEVFVRRVCLQISGWVILVTFVCIVIAQLDGKYNLSALAGFLSIIFVFSVCIFLTGILLMVVIIATGPYIREAILKRKQPEKYWRYFLKMYPPIDELRKLSREDNKEVARLALIALRLLGQAKKTFWKNIPM